MEIIGFSPLICWAELSSSAGSSELLVQRCVCAFSNGDCGHGNLEMFHCSFKMRDIVSRVYLRK